MRRTFALFRRVREASLITICRLCVLAAAAVLAGCALTPVSEPHGQPGVIHVDAPPPPLRETPGPAPGAGYVWVDGHWRWMRSQYVWMPGFWLPPAGPRYAPVEPVFRHHEPRWREPERRWRDAAPMPAPRGPRFDNEPHRQIEPPAPRRERNREFVPMPAPVPPPARPVVPDASAASPPGGQQPSSPFKQPGSGRDTSRAEDTASTPEPSRKGSLPGQPAWKRNRGQEAQQP